MVSSKLASSVSGTSSLARRFPFSLARRLIPEWPTLAELLFFQHLDEKQKSQFSFEYSVRIILPSITGSSSRNSSGSILPIIQTKTETFEDDSHYLCCQQHTNAMYTLIRFLLQHWKKREWVKIGHLFQGIFDELEHAHFDSLRAQTFRES
jgi:hypothetical protein